MNEKGKPVPADFPATGPLCEGGYPRPEGALTSQELGLYEAQLSELEHVLTDRGEGWFGGGKRPANLAVTGPPFAGGTGNRLEVGGHSKPDAVKG